METNFNLSGPNARYAREFNKEINGITCISMLPEKYRKLHQTPIAADLFLKHVREMTRDQKPIFTEEAQEAYVGAIDFALKQVKRGTLHENYLKAARRLLRPIDIVKGALSAISK